MFVLRLLLFCILIVGMRPGIQLTFAAELPTPAEVRGTIAKSLPYIVEKGQWWIEEKKCVSCHRVSFMTWSLAAAQRQGFEVDGRLAELQKWSVDQQLAEREQGGIVGATDLDGVGQLLFARQRTNQPENHLAEYAKFVELIVNGQQADGTWKPAGQLPLQKRPQPETTAVSTMWNTIGLASLTDEPATQSRAKALKWIKSAKPGESNEWFVARLLIEKQFGSSEKINPFIKVLKERQNEDGGWAWKLGDPSDALATGQSLFALRLVGVPIEESAIQRGQRFLIDTQLENGSWSVPGTKKAAKNKPTETAIYWGTCWATIGLLESLED